VSEERLRADDLLGAGLFSDDALEPSREATFAASLRLPEVGATFQGFVLEALVGRGGNGAVYRAHDPQGQVHALKLLVPRDDSAERRERFVREVEAGRTLRHPGVVELRGHGEAEGLRYLVLELLEGARPLDHYARDEDLPVLERVRLVQEIACSVEVAHRVGLIHRDLKPENLLVLPDGRTKLIDLGLARHVDRERLTQSGVLMGTIPYMAPEQVRGDGAHADERTDVYALGAILFELVSGRLPFEAFSPIELIAKIADDEVVLPDCPWPAGVGEVVRKALAKDPAARHPSAEAFARDLAAVLSGEGEQVAERLGRGRRPRRAPVFLALGVLATILLGLALAIAGSSTPPERAERLDAAAHELWRGEGLLSEQSREVADLEARLRGAKGPGGSEVRALGALLHLSSGDLKAAQTARAELKAEGPLTQCLRDALDALGPEDPAHSTRELERAWRAGARRPELLAWRAWSRREVLDQRRQAEALLNDLTQLEGAFAPAPPPDALGGVARPRLEALRVRALLTLERLDEAQRAFEKLTAPSASLARDLGLRRARGLLERDPAAAARLVKGLPAPALAADAAAFGRDVEARAARLVRGGVNQESEDELEALLELRLALLPGLPLDAALLERLVAGAHDFAQATGRLRLALLLTAQHPKDFALLKDLSGLAMRQRKPPAQRSALSIVRRAEEIAPDDTSRQSLRTLRAVVLARANDFGRSSPVPEECAFAARELEQALAGLEGERERGEFLLLQARVLRRQGNHANSLSLLTEALEANPGQHELRFYRGLAVARLGRREEAIADLKAFGESTQDGSDRHLWCGVELWELERPAARETLRRFFSINAETGPGWRVRLASLLGANEREEALRLLADGARIASRSKPARAEWLGEEARAAHDAFSKGDSGPLERLVQRLEGARGKLLRP
jgi:tetratricopeptide (TPR) repeat protein